MGAQIRSEGRRACPGLYPIAAVIFTSASNTHAGLLEPPREDRAQENASHKVCCVTWQTRAPTYPLRARYDDEIFKHLGEVFPELMEEPYEKLTKIDEDGMKSAEGKKRWREFIETYKDKVQDYNFGSLIRTDARDEYAEMNTIFG